MTRWLPLMGTIKEDKIKERMEAVDVRERYTAQTLSIEGFYVSNVQNFDIKQNNKVKGLNETT